MVVEYKIRFVDGGVTVTQTFTGGPKKPVVDTNESDLTSQAPPTANTPPDWDDQPDKKESKTDGSGKADGGGAAFVPGITIVFGSVFCAGVLDTLGSGEPSPSSTDGSL